MSATSATIATVFPVLVWSPTSRQPVSDQSYCHFLVAERSQGGSKFCGTGALENYISVPVDIYSLDKNWFINPLSNSEDPDKMPDKFTFHQGLQNIIFKERNKINFNVEM